MSAPQPVFGFVGGAPALAGIAYSRVPLEEHRENILRFRAQATFCGESAFRDAATDGSLLELVMRMAKRWHLPIHDEIKRMEADILHHHEALYDPRPSGQQPAAKETADEAAAENAEYSKPEPADPQVELVMTVDKSAAHRLFLTLKISPPSAVPPTNQKKRREGRRHAEKMWFMAEVPVDPCRACAANNRVCWAGQAKNEVCGPCAMSAKTAATCGLLHGAGGARFAAIQPDSGAEVQEPTAAVTCEGEEEEERQVVGKKRKQGPMEHGELSLRQKKRKD